uniref:Uncharacterized protein n=1 Tax=Arundo donax TaxID=35708 RepID=A0A0A8XW45_ARUDO
MNCIGIFSTTTTTMFLSTQAHMQTLFLIDENIKRIIGRKKNFPALHGCLLFLKKIEYNLD